MNEVKLIDCMEFYEGPYQINITSWRLLTLRMVVMMQ